MRAWKAAPKGSHTTTTADPDSARESRCQPPFPRCKPSTTAPQRHDGPQMTFTMGIKDARTRAATQARPRVATRGRIAGRRQPFARQGTNLSCALRRLVPRRHLVRAHPRRRVVSKEFAVPQALFLLRPLLWRQRREDDDLAQRTHARKVHKTPPSRKMKKHKNTPTPSSDCLRGTRAR